jgi:glycerophosphoryl diester phosphodiesterase
MLPPRDAEADTSLAGSGDRGPMIRMACHPASRARTRITFSPQGVACEHRKVRFRAIPNHQRRTQMRKTLTIALVTAGLSTAVAVEAATPYNTLSGAAPLVIGHRGASGYRPEHTLEAYTLAIQQGANYIEPDLVMTKDGELLARHEPMLARVNLNPDGTIARDTLGNVVLNRTDTSTNVWMQTKYADRLTVKTLDGVKVGGWFAEDFTAAEIRADIRAQERLRDLRVANNSHNDQYVIPTLQEVIDLAKAKSIETGRTIGIYFLAHTQANGLTRMEDRLVEILHANYGNTSNAPVFIQSFEVSNLQYLNGKTDIQIAQLLNGGGQPYDFTVSGDTRTYANLATATGLDFIDDYADGVGANKGLMIPTVGGVLGSPTTLIDDAHARGLIVHGWTFRAENIFLPSEFDVGTDPAALGDAQGEMRAFLALGMDGFFTDHPDIGVAAVASIPEPGTWAMMAGGLALLGFASRRQVRR